MIDLYQNFMDQIYNHITKKQHARIKCGIIKQHSKRCNKEGDFSFPTSLDIWMNYIDKEYLKREINNSELNDYMKNVLETVPYASGNWYFTISKLYINPKTQYCQIFLNRPMAFRTVIKTVLDYNNLYGFSDAGSSRICYIANDNSENKDLDLSSYRVEIVTTTCKNFTVICGHLLSDNLHKSDTRLQITMKSSEKSNINSDTKIAKILCGPVIVEQSGTKKTNICTEELIRQRARDLQLIAEHRFGIRAKKESKGDFFKIIAQASITFELLQTKINSALHLNLEDRSASPSKGLTFILYNCARISSIIKEFEEKVSTGYYPPLPDVDSLDVTVLADENEWELLFQYVAQYPRVCKSCGEDIIHGTFKPHHMCTYLSNLVNLFSTYYRRVKILTQSREHLWAVMHARMYLLRVIQQILQNGLALFNIEPIQQM